MMTAPAPTEPRTMLPELLRIDRVSREIDDVFTLRLDVSSRPDGFPFSPGQFNMLYAFGVGESAISISGDPSRPRELVHTIRAVGHVTRAMEGLRRGDLVGVRGPFGAPWPLDAAKGRDLLIIAGGLGLAPLRPAILAALARRADYGLDATVEVTVDRAERGWPGNVGVVPSLLARTQFDAASAVAMLCGPEIMMRFTARELARLGVSGDRIFVSMERNMKCGAGLCGHCQWGPTFVCKDGPVFPYDRVERLLHVREI
jgi:NAD(P)H-flavin reductase